MISTARDDLVLHSRFARCRERKKERKKKAKKGRKIVLEAGGPTIEFLTIRRTDRFGVSVQKTSARPAACVHLRVVYTRKVACTHGQKDSPVGDEADSHAHTNDLAVYGITRVLPRHTSNDQK